MSVYGVGVIGAGWVAGEHIRAFENNPHTHVRAISATSVDSAKSTAADFGLECDAYDDYRPILERDDIDIVSVASPPHVHADQAIGAAEAGKHILLEKAIATTLEDSRAIRDAVAKAGVKSVVSFVLRWNPLFEVIKNNLEAGTIGDVFYGEVDYYHGSGPWYGQFHWNVKKEVGVSSLLSAGCHALDALRWFMGGEVAEVMQYSTHGPNEVFAPYEYDPTSVTILKFADGRMGKVASCLECIQPYVFNIDLKGAYGTIHQNRIWSSRRFPGQTGWVEVPTIMPDSGDVRHHPFQGQVDHFVECIEQGHESHCNIAEACITHEVAFAADEAGRTGKPVELPLS
jgi:predicted dehydrogenase